MPATCRQESALEQTTHRFPFPASPVDFNSPLPYYVQVKEALKDTIERGSYDPGYQLPGEASLCNLFAVSRTVIRQALEELEQEGFIIRRKGKGTFIAEPKLVEGLFQKLTGFYEDMQMRGYIPVSQVLRQELIPANARLASRLQIQPGNLILQLDRLRFVNREPIVLVTTYLPSQLVPGLEQENLTTRSLYEVMQNRYGLVITHGKRVIGAACANEYEAQLLQIEKGAPLIVLDSISYLADGTPVEYYHALHRGDRSVFEVELVRAPAFDQQKVR